MVEPSGKPTASSNNALDTLRRVLKWIDFVNQKVGFAAAYLVVVIMVLVAFEVVSRYIFNRPTIWTGEVNQFLFCAIVAFGGGYVLSVSGHVSVDIIYSRFGVRGKAIVSILTSSLIFLYLAIFLWKTWGAALFSLNSLETSGSGWNPPIYPVWFFIPIGAALFLLQAIARFIRYGIQAFTGVEEVKEGSMLIEVGTER